MFPEDNFIMNIPYSYTPRRDYWVVGIRWSRLLFIFTVVVHMWILTLFYAKNLRQQEEYRRIWRDNTSTLRLCGVRSQQWWCHDVWSEKNILDDNDEMSDKW